MLLIDCLFEVADGLLAIFRVPRKAAFSADVDEQVCERFEVVTAGLLITQMGIYRCITNSTNE